MDDNQLYTKIVGLTKAYLGNNPRLRSLEVDEVANTAYVYMKTGKYGLKEDGNPYYAIQYAVNPTLAGNVHVRSEGIHLAQYADYFKTMQDKQETDWTELNESIDSLPYELSQAIRCELYGDKPNRYDLKAGQKAMRDIYDRN